MRRLRRSADLITLDTCENYSSTVVRLYSCMYYHGSTAVVGRILHSCSCTRINIKALVLWRPHVQTYMYKVQQFRCSAASRGESCIKALPVAIMHYLYHVHYQKVFLSCVVLLRRYEASGFVL
jgi:hypothetical protein